MKKQTEKKPKRPAKPPLTDHERHERFLKMANEVDADCSEEAFERAFASVVTPPERKD